MTDKKQQQQTMLLHSQSNEQSEEHTAASVSVSSTPPLATLDASPLQLPVPTDSADSADLADSTSSVPSVVAQPTTGDDNTPPVQEPISTATIGSTMTAQPDTSSTATPKVIAVSNHDDVADDELNAEPDADVTETNTNSTDNNTTVVTDTKEVHNIAPFSRKNPAIPVTSLNFNEYGVATNVTRFTENDIYLFNEGNHYTLFDAMGAHPMTVCGIEGTYFAVWAPNAYYVFVMGDFNNWNNEKHLLQRRGSSGVWEGFIPGVTVGNTYKYYIHSRFAGYTIDKADPYAIYAEVSPQTASVVWELDYEWHDDEWLQQRKTYNTLHDPMSIYELHIGSWRRTNDNRPLSYREMAPVLADYILHMGFTHVEFLPVMEHPFYGSWGYQVTGNFAPTSRYGSPQDFMYLIDYLHQQNIGVILDWVPSHFPEDGHGLSFFDGTHLYEHEWPQKGWHPDWNSYIYNYGRYEVRAFLINSALFWLKYYHVDGLRVDAVASMLYLDYSRKEGEWIPNEYGGRENIEAIEFIRRFNEQIYKNYPGVQTIAEESTSWGMVSRPTYLGGLGFGMKWDMGWMHDTLDYMMKNPIHRKYHHTQLSFRMMYAYSENFVLTLSHDEVVHGKGSLLTKMAGDDWQKFANLRLLYGYMYGQPAKKLLFMGNEFGQWREWNHEASLEWWSLEHASHNGVQRWVRDLNLFYRSEPALYEFDFEPEGFEWIDCNDWENSILSFIRKGKKPQDTILMVCNFTPVVRPVYRVGVPYGGFWQEMLNSDAQIYWGSNVGNAGGVMAIEQKHHGRPYMLEIVLPPLGVLFFKRKEDDIESVNADDVLEEQEAA